jgi:hypothetical protein
MGKEQVIKLNHRSKNVDAGKSFEHPPLQCSWLRCAAPGLIQPDA